jgi:hypothetical protein
VRLFISEISFEKRKYRATFRKNSQTLSGCGPDDIFRLLRLSPNERGNNQGSGLPIQSGVGKIWNGLLGAVINILKIEKPGINFQAFQC